MNKIPKDKRDKLYAELEADIQCRGKNKDKKFVLDGKWKKFVRMQDGFKIFAVDGEWIRNNISVMFGHGGHGYVYEFIPLNEIWISTHHYDENPWSDCGCKNVKGKQKFSKEYSESTIIHEITEFQLMKKGESYWSAHNKALEKEREIGLLPDPYTEV